METIGCTLTHTIAPSFGVGLFRTFLWFVFEGVDVHIFLQKGGVL